MECHSYIHIPRKYAGKPSKQSDCGQLKKKPTTTEVKELNGFRKPHKTRVKNKMTKVHLTRS